ncbi:poly-gamma-glutamate biosynthesis protein PgsC/CapC [Erythrobacter sp. W53]|uniref:poly-gamma-glutamate biosynthesis protein PgsC/CapC n=1 Tax=Erythrobacter sp. W53 TaxID=3425947 RepID=UPI003D7684F6
MELFPLTIFPEGGLASSIITTVWVGVFVMCFFNLRYGWVLSGLVVPGYLVPLVIVKPLAAVVIVIEAVTAYALVWLFSEKLSRGRFPSLFGRDRFMGLILASIASRLFFDGLVLPEFAIWMEDNFDRRIDWEDNLQSFGLVIISLLANQFWKPGLARGLFGVAVTIALTFLIVRYGLMEFTNFRISGVYYLYEGLASSVLASPKAYIILTLTALIASHYNVKYGWDFSGILIPALIALQWYQPSKILTSFVEALIIYLIARLILKLPIMANVTLEGGRKLLLFFNISFAWKMAVGWFIVWQGIDVKTTDFFGFGYLLSTLVAIKAHDKDIFPRLARSTLQVSLAGAVLGNVVGFTLSAASSRGFGSDNITSADAARASKNPFLNELLVRAIGDAHVRSVRNAGQRLSAKDTQDLAELIELLEEDVPQAAPSFNQRAGGWRLVKVEGERLAIVRDDGAGHEMLLYDPSASRELAIILPDPTLAAGLGIAAVELQRSQDARWLVVAAPSVGGLVDERAVARVFKDASDTAHIIVSAAEAGEPSHFAFSDGAARPANVASLRDIVPDMEVRLASEGRGARGHSANLYLSAQALRHIAQLQLPAAVSAAASPCRISRGTAEADKWGELEQLAFARYEIAAPLVAGARAGNAPVLARATAQLGDMDISRCLLGDRPHWRFGARAVGGGNIFLADGAEPQKAVLSFHNGRSTLPSRIAVSIHKNWDADALFVATRSDSFLRDPKTVFDVTWQEWVRSQEGVENPLAFQLRVRPREAIDYRKGVDVLVAKDRIGPEPEGFEQLISSLRVAGLRPETVTNAREQAGMEARPGMSVRYFDGTSERRYAFGWLLMSEKKGAAQ